MLCAHLNWIAVHGTLQGSLPFEESLLGGAAIGPKVPSWPRALHRDIATAVAGAAGEHDQSFGSGSALRPVARAEHDQPQLLARQGDHPALGTRLPGRGV